MILIMGSNMAEAHPVTFDRIKASKKARPEQQIVVIDPRRTATAAGRRPAPAGRARRRHRPAQRPGPDAARPGRRGSTASSSGHTRGFEEYRAVPAGPGPGRAVRGGRRRAGATLYSLAQRIAGAKGFLSFYCMGLNQSTVGMWKNNSLINLHLLTGQIGKPGAGPFSLTGQPNAMGGREGGPAVAPAARLSHRRGRRRIGRRWRRSGAAAPGAISPKPGLTAVEMFRALEKGQLKAIWIAGTNPAVSLPDLHQVRRALAKAQLVVVSGRLSSDRDDAARRRPPAGGPVGREGMDQHQQRAHGQLTARSCGTRPARRCPTGRSSPASPGRWASRLRLTRSRGEVWDEFIQLTRGPAVRHGRHDQRPAARSVDQPAMALPDAGSSRQQAALSRPAASRRRTARRSSCRATTASRASCPTTSSRSC